MENKQVKTNKQVEVKELQFNDNRIKGLATVEVHDIEGDIVRVDGIDLSRHTDKSPIKILANHIGSDNGKPTVVGKVLSFNKTVTVQNGQEVKVLAFEMEFAETDLAKEYKSLVQGGFIDSFSIGFVGQSVPIVNEQKELTGFDFVKSQLFEISLVSIPANQYANVYKSFIKQHDDKIEKLCKSVDMLTKALTVKMADIDDKLAESAREGVKTQESISNIVVDNKEIKDDVEIVKEHSHKLEQKVDIISLENGNHNEAVSDDHKKQLPTEDEFLSKLSDVFKQIKKDSK